MPSEIMRDWYIQKRKETEQQRQDAITSAARKKQSALGQNRTVQPVQKIKKTTPAKSIYQPEPVKNYTVAQPEAFNSQAKRNQAIDALTSISESRLQRPTIMKETAPDRSAAFPSFSSGSLSPSRTVTSAFKEPASVSDRIDSFVKSVNPAEPAATTDDFLSAIMLENAADRREQAEALPGKIEQLNAEIEEARKAGDKEKLYALTREKMQLDFEQADSTLHRNTLLESILDAFGIGEENDGHQSVGEIFRTQEAQAQEKLMEGLSPAEQAAANLGVMGADMLANYGMSAMTGIPFAAYNAVTSGAATGEQALESGVDPDTALALAAGSGAISYGIEKVGGVAGDWGKQLLQKIGGTRIGQAVLSGLPQKAVQYISSLSGNKAAQVLGTGLEEGLENFTEYDLQRLWQNLILDEDTPFDVKQALSEAGAGILFGSTVAGINAAGDTVRQRQIGNELFETGEGLDLLAQGMESQSPSIRAEAERLARQSMEGQVSKTGLGRLYERMASGEESAVDVLLNAGRSGETPEAVMTDALVNGPLKDSGGRKTPQYRILDYNDQESKQAITRQVHDDMVGRGKTVELTDADLQAFADYYPDLRSMKKSERTAILKEKKKQLIPAIKEMLHTMFDGQKVELSVNGSILEARVYNEGINHVSRNMSQEKAAMLRRSQDIFRQAEYLYSTGNDVHSTASSNPDIRQWHYFYVPLKLGDQTVGVRIAVRNMKTDNESQIYDWDIKKGRHTLDNGVTDSSTTPGVSSNASSFENSIPQTTGKVNPAEGQIPDPVGALAGAAPETQTRQNPTEPQPEFQTPAERLVGRERLDTIREQAQKFADAQSYLERVKEAQKPNEKELDAAESIAKGYTTIDNYDADLDFDLDKVLAVAEAIKKYNEAEQPVRELKAERFEEQKIKAKRAAVNSDLWKDKATGLQYQRETMERNIRDIVKNEEEAQRIIDWYFTPVHENEAGRQRFLNAFRKRVRKLNLTKKESQWVQMVGEGVKDIREIPLGMDPIKISNAVAELRDHIYPELYNHLADALVLNGYPPPGRLNNYFPHFNDPNDPITNALRTLGLNIDTRELPTSIAGITETFEPGKRFFPNLLHRESNKTDYDALEGFDRYLEGVSHVIYHTEDIRNLRVLEQMIRKKYDRGKTGKQQIEELTIDDIPDDDFSDQKLDKRFASDMSRLSNFITELHSYTDALAGKKNIGDRNVEHTWSRAFYSVANAMEKRVAANMVALNPGSWVNNLIPLTQGGMELSKTSLVQAMNQTMKSYTQNDGFADRSTFLTNRAGSRRVSQTGLEKATDFLSSPMQMIDLFTANVLVRGRYLDNLKSGMGETAALREADKWAASVMADRSVGALPTIFEKKNPLTRLFTMYQVEVNNQLSHLFKDLPREAKKKGVAWLAATLLEMGVAGWLCNQVYEAIFGRRPAADPIGIALDLKEDLQNENISTGKALKNAGESVLEQVPFTTALNLVGFDIGGRYPIEAAIPDVMEIRDAAMDEDMPINAKMDRIGDELLKPVYYLLPPVGGGQAKKTIEGIQAAAQGGVYSTNSKGGQEMRYPVEGIDAVQAILFGPSSTQNARDYYRDFQPILPEGQEQANEAKARSLPRILEYSYGEEEDKVSGSITLTGKEQQAYQDAFLALLPEEMENVPEETQKKIYTYAEQLARDEALAGKGIDQYEPESWVTKAKQAADNGISIFDYLDIRDAFSDIEPVKDSAGKTTVTTTEQKRDALMSDTRLTPEQKRTIDILLIGGDEEKAADYTNENAYYRSLMSSADQARYDAVDSMTGGMDVNAFEELQTLVNAQKLPDETSLEKKNRVIQSIMDNGFSRRDAYGIWSALSASGADTLSGDREQDVLAALSDSAKQKYRDVSGYFYNLPVSDFAYIQDVLSSCQGIKDANGKTISGSLKEAKLSALQSLGMSWQEANVYYNLVS